MAHLKNSEHFFVPESLLFEDTALPTVHCYWPDLVNSCSILSSIAYSFQFYSAA